MLCGFVEQQTFASPRSEGESGQAESLEKEVAAFCDNIIAALEVSSLSGSPLRNRDRAIRWTLRRMCANLAKWIDSCRCAFACALSNKQQSRAQPLI